MTDDEKLEEIRKAIDLGIEQIKNGEYIDYETSELHLLAEEIKREGLKKLMAERGQNHNPTDA